MPTDELQDWPDPREYAVEDWGFETPCFIWLGGMSGSYGFTRVDGKGMNAQRASWIRNNGPIHGKMQVHHRCRVPLCVRVDHLELKTATDHRRIHPDSKKRSRLTAEAVADIRMSPLSLKQIADKYAISRAYARVVRNGQAPREFRVAPKDLPPRQPTERQNYSRTRLSSASVAEIRSSTLSLSKLSERYGITRAYASLVRRGICPKPASLHDATSDGRSGGQKRGPIADADFVVEDRGYISQCWIWKGRNPASRDYGKIRFPDGRPGQAHIASYEQFIGSVPEGMHLDHLCRVKRCINPSHLMPVSPADNVRSSAKLTWEIVREIRASDEPHTVLAKRFGVHPETIRFVRIGRTWRED